MKECKECEYFYGYDYSDGTPKCDYEGGYENCPYCDSAEIKNNGVKIEIDSGFMTDYIRHTLTNTIENYAVVIAQNEIKNLVTSEIKEKVLSEMDDQIKTVIEREISDFMKKQITVGGGWSEPERKLTRTEYLSEIIEKELRNKFKSDPLKKYADDMVMSAINSYDRKLKDQINTGIKTYFNEATRQVLTENVVSMLMCNDTYKKLSDSMQNFLPTNN